MFKVGDKVVFIESELKNSRLMTVIEVREPICGFLMAECSLGITNGFYPSRYGHATPEEIAAGHRIDLKPSNSMELETLRDCDTSPNCKKFDERVGNNETN